MVRSNYDTLTLKLQDGLDQFERYSEQPKEAAFFKELVRDREQCIVGVRVQVLWYHSIKNQTHRCGGCSVLKRMVYIRAGQYQLPTKYLSEAVGFSSNR